MTVEFTENQGRFTVAQRDIPTGTVVLRYTEGHTHEDRGTQVHRGTYPQGPWYSGTLEGHPHGERGTQVHGCTVYIAGHCHVADA